MFRVVILALLCVGFAAQATEDIKATRQAETVTITLRVYESRRIVVQECQRLGAWPDLDAGQVLKDHPAPGCSVYDSVANTCTIHTPAPRHIEDAARIENIGHETLHCFRGDYHMQH